MNILISGASGTIGTKLVSALEEKHDLRLLSRRKFTDDPRWRQVDLSDIHQVNAATDGIDVVIHLAIATGKEGDFEDDAFNAERMDTNVKGTYNIFEAARQNGIRRVIYTSSLTVVWGYPAPQWIDGDAPAKPVGTYALTKYLGEQIARHYAGNHSIETLCMRIPKPIDIDDLLSRKTAILPQWIAFPDLIQAYELALEVQPMEFEIVTLAGESSKRRWDISKAEKILGYRPKHRLEDLGYELRPEPGDYSESNVVNP
jgi:uronate dehydrogenase